LSFQKRQGAAAPTVRLTIERAEQFAALRLAQFAVNQPVESVVLGVRFVVESRVHGNDDWLIG
jgi:hypothetical protein